MWAIVRTSLKLLTQRTPKPADYGSDPSFML